jgi:hypothetical protein
VHETVEICCLEISIGLNVEVVRNFNETRFSDGVGRNRVLPYFGVKLYHIVLLMEIEGNQKKEYMISDNMQTFKAKIQIRLLTALDNICFMIMMTTCGSIQIFGNDYNKSKPDSGGNQEEAGFG